MVTSFCAVDKMASSLGGSSGGGLSRNSATRCPMYHLRLSAISRDRSTASPVVISVPFGPLTFFSPIRGVSEISMTSSIQNSARARMASLNIFANSGSLCRRSHSAERSGIPSSWQILVMSSPFTIRRQIASASSGVKSTCLPMCPIYHRMKRLPPLSLSKRRRCKTAPEPSPRRAVWYARPAVWPLEKGSDEMGYRVDIATIR